MNTKQPKWLTKLLEVFVSSVEWTNISSPVHQIFTYRCRFNHGDNVWEVTVSPWLHEFYGGKDDGAVQLPTYEVNLLSIADEFDEVNHIGFDTNRLETSIRGKIEKSAVSLSICQQPPSINVLKKVNAFTGEVTNISRY